MVTGVGSVRLSIYVFNKILRDNVSLVNNHVYPPGVRVDAVMPRIELYDGTPAETFAGLGANLPVWKVINYRVVIWDKEPITVNRVAEQVEQAVSTNRNYLSPATISIDKDSKGNPVTTTVNGYFMMLRISGGTETVLNSAMQMFTRTMNIGGRWFQTA